MPNEFLKYGLRGAQFIDNLYFNGEATVMITYGGYLGTGKSSYDFKTMAEAHGKHSGYPDNIPNYINIKKWIQFPPKDFVDLVLGLKKRDKVVCWDDGGLWLFALDWNDPFVKAVCKYLNVARTDFALMKINTPSPRMVAKKIQNFPELVRVKISKSGSDYKNAGKPRLARAYRTWTSPDFKKHGVKGIFKDSFNAMMPDTFFDWYEPVRKEYARTAKELMKRNLEALQRKEKKNSLDAEAELEADYKKWKPNESRINELNEVVKILEVEDRFGEIKNGKLKA